MEHLFVYGTLLKEVKHAVLQPIQHLLTFKSEGYLQGILIDLGNYPAVVENTATLSKVKGEIYSLSNAAEVFFVLDEYEGMNDDDPEYNRKKKIVTLPDGSDTECWVYVYNRTPHPHFTRIANGDYLSFLNNKDNNG